MAAAPQHRGSGQGPCAQRAGLFHSRVRWLALLRPVAPATEQLVTRSPDQGCQAPALVPAPHPEALLRAVLTPQSVNQDVAFGLRPRPESVYLEVWRDRHPLPQEPWERGRYFLESNLAESITVLNVLS